jgi:2-keto-4-pentenoate hydratase/2-oxohepta-3-ene-1,7-dioic acid hydratase in catechol pathway
VVIVDDSIVPIGEVLSSQGLLPGGATTVDLLKTYDALAGRLPEMVESSQKLPLVYNDLAAPIARPSKIWAAAGNYQRASAGIGDARGRGAGADMPKEQLLEQIFLKPTSAVAGPGDAVIIPEGCETIFPELELAVVIGKSVHNVSREEALDAVFGYTVFLDMTARGSMWGPMMQGSRCVRKGFNTFAPFGPWIVTRDEIADPHALSMSLWVNDELRQSARTDAIINGVVDLVHYLSWVGTLEPGDVISTGNPDAPEFQEVLKPGDVIRAAIQDVGELRVIVARA